MPQAVGGEEGLDILEACAGTMGGYGAGEQESQPLTIRIVWTDASSVVTRAGGSTSFKAAMRQQGYVVRILTVVSETPRPSTLEAGSDMVEPWFL